jgi:hypothetical protein
MLAVELSVLFSGEFGRRFVAHLAYPRSCAYFGACGIDECDYCKDWDFSSNLKMAHELDEPSAYGTYIDDVDSILPEIQQADIMVAINLHPDILAEIPAIIAEKGYRLLIVPAEDGRWCPPGLRGQLKRKCEEYGLYFAVPKPFCSLRGDGVVKEFVRQFRLGMPEFEVKIEGNRIVEARVITSDPCGNAYYVARRMKGHIIESVEEFWKDIHQHQCAYPCMASMDRDAELKEAPFHLAGYIMVYQFSKACGIDASEFVPEYFRSYFG